MIHKVCKNCKIVKNINSDCDGCNNSFGYNFICKIDNLKCNGIIVCEKISPEEKEILINKIQIILQSK